MSNARESVSDGEYELVLKFSEEERNEIVAMLEDDGYEKSPDGIRKFLIDCAREDDEEEVSEDAADRARRREARANLFTAAITHPDVLKALTKAAPVAAELFKRAMRP